MVDIFNETKEKVMPEWAKFLNAGDSVQGTYVGKIEGLKSPAYGQEQTVYQLLQDDGRVINVAFGLNKKVIHQDMMAVKFGQIIGFKYKGMIAVTNKTTGAKVNVKDYDLRQDPKIVDEKWLASNKDHMPEVTKVTSHGAGNNANERLNDFVDSMKSTDDLPFSSEGSLTNEDKLAVITKLAKEKLGATDTDVKDKVMEGLGIAFIPIQYQNIIEKLIAL